MDQKLKNALMLFKDYCKTFKLKPTTDAAALKKWTPARGQMIAATFVNDDFNQPPVSWVDPEGDVWFEQDEDLLQPHEPAVAVLAESVVRVSIQHQKRIHPES